jgi:hypothetical protein
MWHMESSLHQSSSEDCTCKECAFYLLVAIGDCGRMDEEEATGDRNERVAAQVEEEQWEDATSGVATSTEAARGG